MAERDLVSYFYPSQPGAREDLVRAIRALLGPPGVAVFETLERVDATERRRMAALIQAEHRRLKQHRIEPVVPRSTRTTAPKNPTATPVDTARSAK